MRSKKTGTSMGAIIDVRKEHEAWEKKGKAKCTECKHLEFGYYCGKKRRSAIDVDKQKHCRFYIKKK